ncbi:MAG: type II toxin-antitoxin system Phd/YefM family antitoxin [Kouleothrix sp.]|jgi:prevent-host-death family protein|nr:type II toxin-antitoxin system Phd/YefM family antitoxin [Kouleothrix sp.]
MNTGTTSKTISTAQAKAKLSEMIGLVASAEADVIIESHGQPKAVLISVAAYDEMQELRKQQRRAQALERLRAAREAIRARNSDITTDDQAEQVAEEFSQEFIQMLKEKRGVRFERS